jgi:GxxExxY protein
LRFTITLGVGLTNRSIKNAWRSNFDCEITYKGQLLEKYFKPDFCCYEKIILETKSVSALDEAHRSQVHNYLKATGFKVGLLVNFGARRELEHERIVY